jgi:L-threonylcarbamoyladenylate synthase
VTAPSANLSGEAPPTRAGEVAASFGSAVDFILDGGVTAGGAGSTLADCTVWPPRILRQGSIRL